MNNTYDNNRIKAKGWETDINCCKIVVLYVK